MRGNKQLHLAVVVMAGLGLASPGCKRAPSTAAPGAGAWATNPADLPRLGPEFSALDFRYLPPLRFELEFQKSTATARAYAWMGRPRPDGTRPGTTIAVIYLGPSRMQRPSLDEALSTALSWCTTALRGVTSSPGERGTVNGVPFARARYHGTEPRTQRPMWGVVYAAVDDQRIFQLSASDTIAPPGGDVPLGENSLLTFRIRERSRHPVDAQGRREAQEAFRRGFALQKGGQLGAAEAEYRRAIRLDPSHLAPHNNLGNVLLDQNKAEEAIAEFRETLALDPDHPMARRNLGNALRRVGRFDEALPELRRAVAIAPPRADSRTDLGACLKKLGNLPEAAAEFREAIRLDPRSARAHANLGNTLADMGNLKAALPELRRAIKLDPHYPAAFNDYGVALVHLGRYQEALAQYRRAQKIQPGYPPARQNEAALLQRMQEGAGQMGREGR